MKTDKRRGGRPRSRGVSLEGRVRDLGHEGDAVVETERGLVLAAGALPGEQVKLTDVTTRGGLSRAGKLRVTSSSGERVEPACEYAERCGGCPLMIASETLERAHKLARVERELAQVPRVPTLAALQLTQVGSRLGYRRRARLAFVGRRVGYHARRDSRVVDVAHCVVLDPRLDAALERVRTELSPHLIGAGELHLALGDAGRPVLAITSGDAQAPALYERLRALAGPEAPFAGISLAFGPGAPACFGELVEVGSDPEGRALRAPMPGFSQANHAVNAALGQAALALADDAMKRSGATHVLELFAGHGNLTLGLAARAARREATLDALELEGPAAQACVDNLARAKLPARVIAGDAERHAIERSVRVVVLDPPRSGARAACVAIAEAKVSHVIYVSCDPATLARDLTILGAAGFAMESLQAFDMFPRTAHVEVLVALSRGK